MKQHNWHKEIKAWADGVEIEIKYFNNDKNIWEDWKPFTIKYWHATDDVEYRIKPQPKLVPFDFSDPSFLLIAVHII